MIITKNPNIILIPKLINRHGLITGATGTGKTVTLRKLVEEISHLGIPCFLADIKGELSGLSTNNPVEFWDLYGELGHPIRTTCTQMGELLLSRLLDLNRVQTGIMTLLYKFCEDNNMYNENLVDIKACLRYLADNAYDFKLSYGNITYSSVGAIQREILGLQKQGVDEFFNKQVFDLEHFFQVDENNYGIINILQADSLIKSPKLYTTFLLWLLSELYEKLPEVGDLEQPKFVFFFDEAHLLFKDCPKILLDKIEMIVRLIRSKAVGVYFVTQSPLDIPDSVARQLGNRVQHALRAFTPKEAKSIKIIAETFRPNRNFNTAKALTELKIGEALVSFLQVDGDPSPVERVNVLLPKSQLQPITNEEIKEKVKNSQFYELYNNMEKPEKEQPIKIGQGGNNMDKTIETFGRSMVRGMGGRVGNQIVRGIFNSFFKGMRGGLGR